MILKFYNDKIILFYLVNITFVDGVLYILTYNFLKKKRKKTYLKTPKKKNKNINNINNINKKKINNNINKKIKFQTNGHKHKIYLI